MEGEKKKLALQTELNFFESHKREWLARYEGKFLLIKGEELIDSFSSMEDAYKDGVRRFGIEPFFIKKLVQVDTPNRIPSLMLGIIHAHI